MIRARMARAAQLGGLLTFFLGLASPAVAQDKGLHLRLLSSPESGKVRALVEPESQLLGPALTPTAADFSLLLGNGNGPAGQLTVSRNGARGGLFTLVVLDDSGSYRTSAGRTLARPAIEDYTQLLGAGDRIALVVFGADAKSYAVRARAADFFADLDDPGRHAAGNRQNRRATNLLAGLGEAFQLMKSEQDAQHASAGLSEILLFTDAGDEAAVSDRDWERFLVDADKRGIRVSAVISEVRGDRNGDGKRMATVTRLRALADQTHGFYEGLNNLSQVKAKLRGAREAAKSWLVLEGTLCGIKPDASKVTAQVQYAVGGVRKAWTDAQTFEPKWDKGSDLPCVVAPACAPACEPLQQCTAAKCVPKACTANENCGTAARCVSGACAQLAAPVSAPPNLLWIWVIAGGALLLLMLAALVLWGRRDKPTTAESPPLPLPLPPAPPAPPAPLVSEPLAVPAAVSERIPVAPVLNPLPETHLQAIGGAIRPGEKWRLHKPQMYVGASADPSDANDIVFNIAAISSRHALFELFPSGDLWITDQNARNGTYVNGQKLSANERVKLRVGDQVKLSQQLVLQVVRPGFAATPEPPGDERAPSAAAPSSPPGKKHTVFDPGNR